MPKTSLIKKLIPSGKWTRITLLWSFLQVVIIAALEVYIVTFNYKQRQELNKYEINENTIKANSNFDLQFYLNNYFALTIYQILFIVAQAFQFLLTVDTVTNFSTIQLIALAVFNTFCLAYAVVQYIQAKEIESNISKWMPDAKLNDYNIDTFEYIIIGCMSLFVVVWWCITFRLYKIFGWNVFKQLGADIDLKRRLRFYHILLTLLKLNVFFFLAFIVQYIVLVLLSADAFNLSSIVILGVMGLGLLIGYIATLKCNRFFLSIFIFTLSASIGFMASVLTDIYTTSNDKKFSNSKNSLTYTITGAISCGFVTFFITLINFKNFGEGIPKAINNNDNSQKGMSKQKEQKRWSIE